jgi:hypothetical protein
VIPILAQRFRKVKSKLVLVVSVFILKIGNILKSIQVAGSQRVLTANPAFFFQLALNFSIFVYPNKSTKKWPFHKEAIPHLHSF